jgi:S-DNA-T family DNA segregation ATPase FtsK/SpoIIIE
VLVTPEQLGSVLARLRGEDEPVAATPAPVAPAAPVDLVADSLAGYDEVEVSSDEDAWNLTDRD